MTARRLVAALTGVLVLLAGGACGGSATADSVTVLATWTGAEQAAFQRVLDRFTGRTGITVAYTGTRDADNVLQTGIRDGRPPDVAALSTPYELNRYAHDGKLVDLDPVLDRSQVTSDYSPQWTNLMRAGTGSYYAVVMKATLKSLIWYSPAVFRARGYQPPRTWDELTGLAGRIRAAGGTPWCLGLESTPASGWPGTDWIEDILLHEAGPDVYQRWAAGTLPWTSDAVTHAWQTWGRILGDPAEPSAAVAGGARTALLTDYGDAGRPMFARAPGCYLDHQPSFITASYAGYRASGYVAGTDFTFLPFPAAQSRYANAEEVAADLVAMFRDTPAARKLIAFLTSTEAQQIWPSQPGSGAVSVDNKVPTSVYGPGSLWPAISQRLAGAAGTAAAPATLSFDASDLMPTAMQTAFYQGVLQFVADPAQLPAILDQLDQARRQAYG